MRTTIDSAGRVVVPKAIREELGLKGGEVVEVTLRDGRVEIEPPLARMRLVDRGGLLVAEPETALPPLTSEDVRKTIERIRR
jgi:AbrB family looped-hinge helix DNA binding protein